MLSLVLACLVARGSAAQLKRNKATFLALQNSSLTNVTEITDDSFGEFLTVKPETMGFDRDTSTEERDDNYHFFIFADKTRVYAWDPLRKTPIRVIGADFTNIAYMVTDSDDSDNDYLFIADNNENNT